MEASRTRVPEDTWLSSACRVMGCHRTSTRPSGTLLGKWYRQGSPPFQAWLSFLGVTGSAYRKDINGQPARETGLAAEPNERQVGMQQPTCLNWSHGQQVAAPAWTGLARLLCFLCLIQVQGSG